MSNLSDKEKEKINALTDMDGVYTFDRDKIEVSLDGDFGLLELADIMFRMNELYEIQNENNP